MLLQRHCSNKCPDNHYNEQLWISNERITIWESETSTSSNTIFQNLEATAVLIWYMKITRFTKFLVKVHNITWLMISKHLAKKKKKVEKMLTIFLIFRCPGFSHNTRDKLYLNLLTEKIHTNKNWASFNYKSWKQIL